MTELFSIPIPVAPHVKKYLTTIYGDYYTLSLDDALGILLHAIITRKTSFDNTPKNTTKLSCSFEFKFSLSIFQKFGFTFEPKDYFYIGKMLDKYFREKMYEYAIINSVNNNINCKRSMKEFMDFFEITEEDVDLESLYRDFKRQKKQPKIENSLNNALKKKVKMTTN